MSKIAICQPYFAPYMGYYQLINAVDVFVSYDDVNFIKNGWINRNRIMVNGAERLFTIPLKSQSSFKKINETLIDWDSKHIKKFFKTLEQAYSKAEYKNEVMAVMERIFEQRPDSISGLALTSLQEFCKYLEIDTEIKVSSLEGYEKVGDRVKNLINICETENIHHYINPIGGTKLYDKEEFESYGVKLNFIQGMGSLSIIDVCMSRTKEEIQNDLDKFKLV